MIKEESCMAEMAVRYAALSACRKVHTWRWPIGENRSFLFWMFARKTPLFTLERLASEHPK